MCSYFYCESLNAVIQLKCSTLFLFKVQRKRHIGNDIVAIVFQVSFKISVIRKLSLTVTNE